MIEPAPRLPIDVVPSRSSGGRYRRRIDPSAILRAGSYIR